MASESMRETSSELEEWFRKESYPEDAVRRMLHWHNVTAVGCPDFNELLLDHLRVNAWAAETISQLEVQLAKLETEKEPMEVTTAVEVEVERQLKAKDDEIDGLKLVNSSLLTLVERLESRLKDEQGWAAVLSAGSDIQCGEHRSNSWKEEAVTSQQVQGDEAAVVGEKIRSSQEVTQKDCQSEHRHLLKIAQVESSIEPGFQATINKSHRDKVDKRVEEAKQETQHSQDHDPLQSVHVLRVPGPSSPANKPHLLAPFQTSQHANIGCTTPRTPAKNKAPNPSNLSLQCANPIGRIRCAFMTRSDKKIVPPIGNPFQDMKGWALELQWDAGIHGSPYISLCFRVKNGTKNQLVPKDSNQYTSFSATWRPRGESMISAFKAFNALKSQRGLQQGDLMLHHPAVVDLCPPEESHKLQQLIAITFRSSNFEKPQYSPNAPKPWTGLPQGVLHGLDSLFFQKCPKLFTIWFCAEGEPDDRRNSWIRALYHAVNG